MISTPIGAYWWLRELGLEHETCLKLIRNRQTFEYFVAVIFCMGLIA